MAGSLTHPIAQALTSNTFTAAAHGGTVVNALGSNTPATKRSGVIITNHHATDYLLVKMRVGSTLSTVTTSNTQFWIPPQSSMQVAARNGIIFDVLSSTANTIAGNITEYAQ